MATVGLLSTQNPSSIACDPPHALGEHLLPGEGKEEKSLPPSRRRAPLPRSVLIRCLSHLANPIRLSEKANSHYPHVKICPECEVVPHSASNWAQGIATACERVVASSPPRAPTVTPPLQATPHMMVLDGCDQPWPSQTCWWVDPGWSVGQRAQRQSRHNAHLPSQ